MNEEGEYIIIGVKSYGRDFLGAIDKSMKHAGIERVTEGGQRVWKKGNQVLAIGLSIGSAEVARIHKDILPSVLSEFATKPVHPLDDYKVVAPYSQDLNHELLALYRRWILGRKILLLLALMTLAFVVTLRLLIYSKMFQAYESVFEFYSYAIGVLPLCFGLGSLWYMHMGHKVLQLIEHVAVPCESTAFLVRFSRSRNIDFLGHKQVEKENDTIGMDDTSHKPSEFAIERSVADYVEFSGHTLYVLVLDRALQELAMNQIRERDGTLLAAGCPHTINRALFSLKITFFLISGTLFFVGLLFLHGIWDWLFGYAAFQFWGFMVVCKFLRKADQTA